MGYFRQIALFFLAVGLTAAFSTADAGVISYVRDTDFGTAAYSSGDVTAQAELVPGVGNAVDFESFTPGRIAIIERGDIPFSHKTYFAQVYGGAVAVIILNQPGDTGSLGMAFASYPEDPPAVTDLIPTVRLSSSLSELLRAELLAGPAVPIQFRVKVSVIEDIDESVLQRFVPDTVGVPEPATLVIWGLTAAGCFVRQRRSARTS